MAIRHRPSSLCGIDAGEMDLERGAVGGLEGDVPARQRGKPYAAKVIGGKYNRKIN
jgi:hypothetical protein